MAIQKTPKQKRISFPYVSMKDALVHINKLKAYKGFAEMPITDALSKMGYTPTSSSADRALSAMVKSYELLGQNGSRASGGNVWLSPIAKKILLNSPDSQDRKDAIIQATLNDELIQMAVDKWSKADLSRSEIISKLQLDHDFDFTESAAIRFATVIQETFEVLAANEYNGTNVQEEPEEQGDDMNTPILENSSKTSTQGYNDYTMPYDGGRKKVILRAPVDMTEAEFKRMLEWIGVLKDGMVKQDEKQEEPR